MDCAPGGCGTGWSGAAGLGDSVITPSLTRPQIDDVCTDSLMWTIVSLMVKDAMSVRPTLSGETGELTPTIDWLNARGFWPEATRAMIYAWQYGGGGLLCIIDDGKRADEEVDVLGLRDVVGYYALPKWYLVPDGVGSSRVQAGWYGQRIGRPECYYATSVVGLGDSSRSGSGDRQFTGRDINKILGRSGGRFHRSRVIPWPFRDDMDLRLARWLSQWNGWGPGIVESCLEPFLARRNGALRLAAIMDSIVVNTLTIADLEARQSTPDLGAALQARLDFIKWCRDYTSASVPLIALDPQSKLESVTHHVAGIDKVIAAQRQFLLDVLPYTGVVLHGDSTGGLNGGDREGEHRAYASRVHSLQDSWCWTAGSFGGGIKQAVRGALMCRRGPTDGRDDPTVTAVWPSIAAASPADEAERLLKHAQRRAQDGLTLDLTPEAMLRYDPTIRETYPGLDVDEGPLPVLATPTPGTAAPGGTTPALAEAGPAESATTPGAVNEALAGQREAEEPGAPAEDAASAAPLPPRPAPAVLPTDVHTEAEIAAAMKLSRPALRKLLADAGIRPIVAAAPGARGGGRYSLGEVLAAWRREAEGRADAARGLR